MKANEADITQDLVRTLLAYDPETGIFRWHTRENVWRGWNGKNAGTIAGAKMTNGYINLGIFNRKFLAHRIAWLYVHGEWPPTQIDHCNMVRDDNRLVNLRLATNAQNTFNRPKQANCASGYRGVSLHKKSGLYHATITVGGKTRSLRYFKTASEASAAYERAAAELHGEYYRPSR